MAEAVTNTNVISSSSKKRLNLDDINQEDDFNHKKQITKPTLEDPSWALANGRHIFGEHGELGPDRDFFIYSRHFNPTVLNLSRQIAAMEGTEAAYCTSSGMSAISSVLLQLVNSGEHIVASPTLYGETHALLAHFLPRKSNIKTSFVDIRDLQKVKETIVKGHTKVLYFESISNPTLTVANIPEL
ncbi:methionine gamma-lyase-like protein [Tanacetum coccineum]